MDAAEVVTHPTGSMPTDHATSPPVGDGSPSPVRGSRPVAVGTAVGSGLNPATVEDRAHKSGEASRPGLEANMRLPMRRFQCRQRQYTLR